MVGTYILVSNRRQVVGSDIIAPMKESLAAGKRKATRVACLGQDCRRGPGRNEASDRPSILTFGPFREKNLCLDPSQTYSRVWTQILGIMAPRSHVSAP
jgi:hypothetical protein